MKRFIFSLLVIMSVSISAFAGWNFQSGVKYYIQTNYNTSGYVSLGSSHSVSYPVYYVTGDLSDDCYWYISGNDTNGYTFQNASTGGYLAWSSDYTNDRYLNVSSTDDGSTTRWTLEHNTAGYVVIRNVASSDYVFDMRTGTYQVGTYVRSSGFTTNEQFNIYDADGTSAWVDEGTSDDGYTEDGYDSTEKWSGSDDVHDFTEWSFPATSTSSSITSTRTEIFKASAGARVFFDWTLAAPESTWSYGPSSTGTYSFTVTLDGSTVLSYTSAASGTYSSDELSAGTHTLVLTYTYTKSGSSRPGGSSSSTTGSVDVTNFFISNVPAKTLTVHCLSNTTGEVLETDEYEFYTKSYTISDAPAISHYNYFSGDLPYTATETTDIYLYYTPKEMPKTTTISGGTFADDTQWYRLKIRGSKYLNYDSDNNQVNCTSTSETMDYAYYWCLTKDASGCYSIYNYMTGASMPLTATSYDDGTALTMESSSSSYYQAFDLSDNSNGGFNIQIPGVESCANDYGSQGILRLWYDSESVSDNGSNVTFEAISNAEIKDIESLTLDAGSLSINLGATAHLTYTYTPEDATRTGVSWTSSDPSVATVSGGLVKGVKAGTATITVSFNYDTSVSASCEVTVIDPNAGTYLTHGTDNYYLQLADNALIVIPKDFVKSYTYSNNVFTATLTSGDITYNGVKQLVTECPYDMPAFKSYKFNNKFNYQVFTDVVAEDPTASLIELNVAGIGKRLTPSFQLDSERMEVWVGDTLQDSKHTRMRFDKPITYTITYDNWRKLEILQRADKSYKNVFKPFGRKTVVDVNWLNDNSSNSYQVPEIYITTDDGSVISDKTTLKDAHIEIKGGGVYPDMESMAVQIKGRGNTSWGGYGSKNPYRLKFASKQKPLGMTKGKSWVLLANKQTGSMTTNAIGQKIASLMNSEFPCHIVPVELYINDYYQGSYNLCEKVGISNNSVSLDDETYAAMMELDTYADDGETPNTQNAYGLNVKINDPGVEDDDYDGKLTYDGIFSDFNNMTKQLYKGDASYTDYVDTKALVNYLATCELMCNCEMKHPKSIFCYSENVTDDLDPTGKDATQWKFGPLWDCDWAFGYEQKKTYYQVNQTEDFFENLITGGSSYGSAQKFWKALRYNSNEVDSLYFRRWNKFMNEGGLEELIEFCDDYYTFAAPSLNHNSSGQFASDGTDYESLTTDCKSWLQARCEHIYNAINHYTIETESTASGDVNNDGLVNMADVARLVAILCGKAKDTYGTADLTCDGQVDLNDVLYLKNKLLGK